MEPRYYKYTVIPQEIDFTGKARFSTIVNAILNTAGEDARVNGFGIDVLSERNLGWVLSRLAVELDHRPLEQEEYTVETWVTEYVELVSHRLRAEKARADGEGCGRRRTHHYGQTAAVRCSCEVETV